MPINKTNNKRIPVPDPGVPALPETDTSTPSPSVGPSMDRLVKCWPYFSLPFSNTKVSRASFQFQVLQRKSTRKMQSTTNS
ncbi:hypothetical protein ACLKA6_000230 [Drosophila palustris]